MKAWLQHNILYLAFLQALVATLGSLYFSEVMKFTPCTLCWYQRIAMYPLVLLLAVGIIRRDKQVASYILPLSLIGWGIAVYHNLLYFSILPERSAPCAAGISCTSKFVEWFGFVTIPFLSFVAFSVISAALIFYQSWQKKDS